MNRIPRPNKKLDYFSRVIILLCIRGRSSNTKSDLVFVSDQNARTSQLGWYGEITYEKVCIKTMKSRQMHNRRGTSHATYM